MIRECFLVNTGIQFHREAFTDVGLDPDALYPFVHPRPPALAPSAAQVTQVKAAAHAAEPTDETLTEVEASSTADSTFTSEEIEDVKDALSPIYDQLKESKLWWILEFIPMRFGEQDRRSFSMEHHWKYVFALTFIPLLTIWLSCRINLGSARNIPEPVSENGEKVLVHRSVKTRMEAEGLKGGKYVPKAEFIDFDHEWVD